MSYPRTVQTGRLPRRFKTPDFKDVVPDSLQHEDGHFTTNPEWEKAEYEEIFMTKKGRLIEGKSLYEAFREIHKDL